MRLYLLPTSFSGQKTIELTGRESQYLTRVLRLKPGQNFAGRDASGNIWDLTLLRADRSSCTLECVRAEAEGPKETTDSLPDYQGPLPKLFLFQCLCKGKKLEQIVRQATELGAWEIIPVQSRFCVVDISNKKQDSIESRTERLDSMVKEAIQQSGSRIPTTVASPISFAEIPSYWNTRGLGLFFHQSDIEGQESLTTLVRRYRQAQGPDAAIAVVVGAEGGLASEETVFLEKAGFKAVLLKTNILRAETAAVYALAAVQTLMTED